MRILMKVTVEEIDQDSGLLGPSTWSHLARMDMLESIGKPDYQEGIHGLYS